MGIREALQRSPVISVAIVIVLLAIAVGALVTQIRSRRPGVVTFDRPLYYFDLGTSQLFTASSKQVPPIAGPSGKQAVRAVVFACGQCEQASQRRIAHLVKHTDDAKARLEAAQGRPTAQLLDEVSMTGTMVALVPETGEPAWFSMNTPQGMTIAENYLSRCPGGNLAVCEP